MDDKLKIVIVSLIVLTLLFSGSIFIKKSRLGFYVYNGQTINGKLVYENKMPFGGIICEPIRNYSVIYEDGNTRYTSSQVYFGSGCFSTYYIYYEGEVISFNEAVETGVISIDDLNEFDFKVDIDIRYIFHHQEDIVEIRLYEDVNDKTILISGDDYFSGLNFDMMLYSFENISYEDSTFLFYMEFVDKDGNVYLYECYQDYLLEVNSGYIAEHDDYNWVSIIGSYNYMIDEE